MATDTLGTSQLVVILVVISGLNQQVAENVFGPYFGGRWMKFIAIGTGIAFMFAAKELAGEVPDLAALKEIDTKGLISFGVMVGFGSQAVHALFSKYLPDTKKDPLAELPKGTKIHIGRSKEKEYMTKVQEIMQTLRENKITLEQAQSAYQVVRALYPDQPDVAPPEWGTSAAG